MRGRGKMKRILAAILILTAAFAAGGCSKGGGAATGDTELAYIVNLYFVNSKYAATGDDTLPALSCYEKQTLMAKNGEQYFALLDTALRDGAPGSGEIDTMITDKVQFNSVEVKDGVAYVDIKGDGLSGSSLEEGLLISQITDSLISSFEEIKKVQFLIDGNVPETLMGHYDTTQPFETGIYSL